MVDFPPFLPSSRWYASWFREAVKGRTYEEATAMANSLTLIAGKDFARCRVADHNGNHRLIGMAIDGGASVLKNGRRSFRHVTLSNHGNWRLNHIGTLEALYGRCPYFQHLMPSLKECYLDDTVLKMTDFNRRLHNVVIEFLNIPEYLEKHSHEDRASVSYPEIPAKRGEEVASGINPDLSIIDAVMRLGPETLLALPSIGDTIKA